MSVENLKLEVKLLDPPIEIFSYVSSNWIKKYNLPKIEYAKALQNKDVVTENVLGEHAARLKKKDGTVVTPEQLKKFLEKEDPKTTSQKRKSFKESIEEIDGEPFSPKKFDEFIAELSSVLNPIHVYLNFFNVEMPTMAAMYGDTSLDSVWDILIGRGRSSPAGKPYYPLAEEVGFAVDRAKAGHKSLLNIPQFVFSIDGITRYGMFMLNSAYNTEWREVEEKSGRDVPLNRISIPPEYSQDQEFERLGKLVAQNVNSAYEALDQITGRTGKLMSNYEDGRYVSILAASTATSISMNYHNFVELTTAVKCNEKEVSELKLLCDQLKENLSPIAPDFAREAINIGRELGYTLPKPGLEAHFDENSLISWFEQNGKNARLLKLSFTGEKIPEIRGLADEGLKAFNCEYVVRGSNSFAAQQMRHNSGWQTWLSFGRIPHYWTDDKRFVTVPPAFQSKEKAVEIFEYVIGETRDFVLSNCCTRKPFFYAYPLALHTVGAFRMDGFGLVNYLNQRTSPHAQWEIRNVSRELHNQIISHAHLGGVFYEILQSIPSYKQTLQEAVNSDKAFEKDGKIYFAN